MKNPGTSSKKVSVIVPNYNHAEFLCRRLESIDAQSYRNMEVILLDDCSTDGSAQILEEYQRKKPENTKLIRNNVNSGSSFRQWERGIEQSTGELIWIAESDDYCEAHFLETLVSEFEDETVGIAYTIPRYVNSGGGPTEWCFEIYSKDLSPERWHKSYKATGEDEVQFAMGVKNTMVNVSSLVMRRSAVIDHLMNEDWTEMGLCGDWLLYLKILKRYSVSYVKEAGAFFVQSEQSAGYQSARGEKYSREHQVILAYLENAFPNAGSGMIDANIHQMMNHWMAVSGGDLPEHVKSMRYVRYGEREDLLQQSAVLKSEHDATRRAHDACMERIHDLEKAYNSIISSRTWRWTGAIRSAWNEIHKIMK